MALRSLNYTGRKRIRRETAQITLRDGPGAGCFDAQLTFEEYDLPQDARVFVEAYRQARYMRFDFGTVESPGARDGTALVQFDEREGILFRVKVVTAADPPGLLLAVADQIRPRATGLRPEEGRSLLPVKGEDLGEEVWRLEFDDGQQVLLLVNDRLGDWRSLARGPEFRALVLPQVLRLVLQRVVQEEGRTEVSGDDDWCDQWLQFALQLPGVGAVPAGSDEGQAAIWVDDAVQAFCRRNGILSVCRRFWNEGGQ